VTTATVRPPTSRKDAVLDVLVVSGVAVAYVLLEALAVPKRWSYGASGVALVLYLAYLARRRTDSWYTLGFRSDNLLAGLFPFSVMTLVAGAALIGIAIWRGTTAWSPEILILLLLYPTWALVQQLAFQGVLHRRLMLLVRPQVLQVLGTAALFALVHVGNPLLTALTFTAGVVWSLLFRRWPNLWLLAASHTVLAALAYPLVLADAPLSRF
jgi:membrane protease YdiL (CAAX protease family)